ncbi:hypothetical protein PPYR_04046 [Photinus pyralis]|uniref:Reverse transcriptase domain-containing protein n=1 Tax=Photinus pyralis TaxID=7054 RepID=A0A5N4AXH4_PHOPY|nr:hypothetical protein PPYR_04046 [Photinus pyralis]
MSDTKTRSRFFMLLLKLCINFPGTKCIPNGVPQGSILGPLRFLAYINDLPSGLPKNVTCILYADDLTLLTSDRDLRTAVTTSNNTVHLINEWCQSNQLRVNCHKTALMHFTLKTA